MHIKAGYNIFAHSRPPTLVGRLGGILPHDYSAIYCRNIGKIKPLKYHNLLSSKGKPMLLMIDNYDSFTYNLVQHLGEIGEDIKVFRNDKVTIKDIEELKPERIVISPGPCTPKEAGVSVDVIKYFAGKIPILGVCLGHQAIGAAFGGDIIRAPRLMHGKHP